MKIINSVEEMREYCRRTRQRKHKLGFVPTMGALHDGHLSLVKAASVENDRVAVSIFVNPAQFGPNEDFSKYPRDLKKDMRLLKETRSVDCVFTPDEAQMYPEGYASYVNVESEITAIMCGVSRPGHFKGVATIVARLLNIIWPDTLYLGQKDLQQAAVIKKMASDLNYGVSVVICPIIREKDGLAMSSRNIYLTPEQRNSAAGIYASLKMAESMIRLGEDDPETVIKEVKRKIRESGMEPDYAEIVDPETLEKKERITGAAAVAAAAYAGKTRLIDNIIVDTAR